MSFIRYQTPICIYGPSHYLPGNPISNAELCEQRGFGIPPEKITAMTGIECRYWARPNEAVSDLAVAAGKNLAAFSKAQQLLLITSSGDHPSPPTAAFVHRKLQLEETAGALDLGAACTGFVSGLHVGGAMAHGSGETILCISADMRSHWIKNASFNTAVLFGDGAAAALLRRDDQAFGGAADFRLLASANYTDSRHVDLIKVEHGGSRSPIIDAGPTQSLVMLDGAKVMVAAVKGMARATHRFLETLELKWDQIDWLVPHQANFHLIKALSEQLSFPFEKTVNVIAETGNTAGASVGIGLAKYQAAERFRSGERLLLVGAGGGGLAACALLECV